jgi:hypothetical protein
MTGGLLQIVAYGAQDMYLTNNPQITFFKVVYRRHTNFSIEVFEHTFLDKPNFGTRNELTLPRNGDLVTKMCLKITIPSVTPNEGSRFAWVKRLGYAIMDSIEIEMGGVIVDKQLGIWLDIWQELASNGHDKGYSRMLGDVQEMTKLDNCVKPQYNLFIPLKFWFNRNIGLALPIIAIQYHEIRFNLRLNNLNKLIVTDTKFDKNINIDILDVGLLVDYVYLDKEERKRFAQIGHEYLIEQVQFTGEEPVSFHKIRDQLHFNYPTKEIIWAMRNGNYTTGKNYLCYTHKSNWNNEIQKCSEQIVEDSIILSDGITVIVDGIQLNTQEIINGSGNWEQFNPRTESNTMNNKIIVSNMNKNKTVWINTESLLIDDYNIFDKISGTIIILEDDTIILQNISSKITVRDISIPIEEMTDTRIKSNDVLLNQFSNYGILIDGSINPIEYAKLEFNNEDRFAKRSGKFFNYLQPGLYHSNTPKDGINLYSFSITPEEHQPSGTANLSKIEKIIFSLWINDSTEKLGYPNLNLINLDNRLYIFALSYNILRISNGLTGISYNG